MRSQDRPYPAPRELTYFRRKKLAFLVAGDPSDDQLSQLFDWGNKVADGKATLTRGSVLRYPSSHQLEPLKMQAEPPKGCKRPMVERRGPFALISADVEGVKNNAALVELILRLDDARANAYPPDSGLTLELALPDWLASGAPHGIGSGGPGSEPLPFNGKVDEAPYDFDLPIGLSPLDTNKGAGVEVAILDTAPCLHDMAEAYMLWQHASRSQPKIHPLIEALLGPNSRLKVYPAAYEDLVRLAGSQLDSHRYGMTDHGLFVAGIINTLAPQANLHLVEVLNPYGLGDLESICKGLAWVVTELVIKPINEGRARKPLVVNCSLVLNIPLEEGHYQYGLDWRLQHRRSIDEGWLRRQGWPIQWVCDLLYHAGARVIAAAGNDRNSGAARPQARYPAALESVLGVGAHSQPPVPETGGKLETASYSNKSDIPLERGITSLGGEPGDGKGVLGLYIGEFPNRSANETGWAWWAGTSFATPVISGAAAAVLSGMPGSTTQDAIEQLYAAQPFVTVEDEDVLKASQKRGP